MSLLVTNCHGYRALGITPPSTPTKVWIFGWFKAANSGSFSGNRGILQFTASTLDGTRDYVGLEIDGSNVIVGKMRTGNVNNASPDPGDFYMWNSANYGKWTVGCAQVDLPASSADLKCIYGRAAATAKAATTQTFTSADMAAFSDSLVDIYVATDRRKVGSGTGTTNDGTDNIKVAYLAIGLGSLPTQSNIQSAIDGTHPADLTGIWEYWDLTDSGAGLVGAKRGITLSPFGGSATTTWDGADNPTVSAPTTPSGAKGAMHFYRAAAHQ